MKISVTLSGDVLKGYGSYGGNYDLAPDLVNGKASWSSEDGTNAIWFDKSFRNWLIGQMGSRGTSTAAFITPTGTAYDGLPNEVKPWKWYVNGGFAASDDIVVEGIDFYSFSLRFPTLNTPISRCIQ